MDHCTLYNLDVQLMGSHLRRKDNPPVPQMPIIVSADCPPAGFKVSDKALLPNLSSYAWQTALSYFFPSLKERHTWEIDKNKNKQQNKPSLQTCSVCLDRKINFVWFWGKDYLQRPAYVCGSGKSSGYCHLLLKWPHGFLRPECDFVAPLVKR